MIRTALVEPSRIGMRLGLRTFFICLLCLLVSVSNLPGGWLMSAFLGSTPAYANGVATVAPVNIGGTATSTQVLTVPANATVNIQVTGGGANAQFAIVLDNLVQFAVIMLDGAGNANVNVTNGSGDFTSAFTVESVTVGSSGNVTITCAPAAANGDNANAEEKGNIAGHVLNFFQDAGDVFDFLKDLNVPVIESVAPPGPEVDGGVFPDLRAPQETPDQAALRRKNRQEKIRLLGIALDALRRSRDALDSGNLKDARNVVGDFERSVSLDTVQSFLLSQELVGFLELVSGKRGETLLDDAATIQDYRRFLEGKINEVREERNELIRLRNNERESFRSSSPNVNPSSSRGSKSDNLIAVTPKGEDGSGGASFRVDVNGLASAVATPAAGTPAFDGLAANLPFNVWFAGDVTAFDDDQTADRDGTIVSLKGGATHRLNDDVTVGGFVTYKTGDVESKALNTDLDSDFIGFGLFSRVNVYHGLFFDTVFHYEYGWNDIRIGTAKGDFNADSVSLGARLHKRFALPGGWWVGPNVALSWSQLDRDAYTDSTGTRVPGGNTEQTRLTIGPRAGYFFTPESEDITQGEVTAGIDGVFDLNSNGNQAVGNGVVAKDPTDGVKLSTGLNLLFKNGMTGSGNFSYTGIDSLDAYSARFGLNVPLN